MQKALTTAAAESGSQSAAVAALQTGEESTQLSRALLSRVDVPFRSPSLEPGMVL